MGWVESSTWFGSILWELRDRQEGENKESRNRSDRHKVLRMWGIPWGRIVLVGVDNEDKVRHDGKDDVHKVGWQVHKRYGVIVGCGRSLFGEM